MKILNANQSGPESSALAARRGGALLPALIAVMVVTILTASALQFTTSVTRRQIQSVDTKLAFYMAEAGLAEAYSGLMIGKTGNVGTPERPAAFGSGLFWVEATDSGSGRVELESTGMVNSGRATLSLVVERLDEDVTSLHAFSDTPLEINPGTLIDGYDSSAGRYEHQADMTLDPPHTAGGGIIGSNGSIDVSGDPEATGIYGDVVPGPLSSVTPVGDVSITGTTEARDASEELPPLTVPEMEMKPVGVSDVGVPLIISSDGTGYDVITLSDGARLIFQGPASVVLGSLTATSGSEILFDTLEGEVDVYVTDALSLESGSTIETSGEDTSAVSLLIAAPTRAGDAVSASLQASGRFYGWIYAPDADVQIGEGFELFGAVIARQLILDPGVRLHVDTSATGTGSASPLPRLISWRIIEMPAAIRPRNRDPFSALGLDKSALPLPTDAHEDQLLEVTFEKKSGSVQEFSGMESAFDWTDVAAVTELARDGVEVVSPEKLKEAISPDDQKLIDLLNNASLSSSKKKDYLKDNSPLTETVLLEMTNHPDPLDGNHMRDVYKENAPLSDVVLLAMTTEAERMSSGELEDVYDICVPLSDDVLSAMVGRTDYMDSDKVKNVLKDNSPLSESVLQDVVTASPSLDSNHLEDVLLETKPLPASVLTLVVDGTAPLTAGDRQKVLDAQ